MKKTLLICMLCCLTLNSFGQNYLESKFYTSFYSNLYVTGVDQLKVGNEYHSIKLKTNQKGHIVSWEPSLSMSESTKRDIAHAFNKSDKTGLVDFKLRNKILIIPYFIISSQVQSKPNDRLWSFEKDENSPSLGNYVLLTPIVYYISGEHYNN